MCVCVFFCVLTYIFGLDGVALWQLHESLKDLIGEAGLFVEGVGKHARGGSHAQGGRGTDPMLLAARGGGRGKLRRTCFCFC